MFEGKTVLLFLSLVSVSPFLAREDIERAVWENDIVKVAAMLHENPAFITSRNDLGQTLLHVAVSAGFEERPQLVELLLRSGADVNARGKYDGQTPLHAAAMSGRNEDARLLIAFSANINLQDNEGRTALNWAAANGHPELAELLLAHGAKMDAFDATALGKLSSLRQLLEENPTLIYARGGIWGRPLLEIAAAKRQKQAAELLIGHGARLDIYTACALGRLDEMRRFLDANPGLLSANDGTGQTPLHWAVRGGQKEAVELLLARGADVTAGRHSVGTPLLTAAEVGDKEIAILLLAHGAARDAEERAQVLRAAMAHHHQDLVDLLLKNPK